MKTGEANLPPPLRAYDLELAARYAERRATELRDEVAIAETYHAKRSLTTEAQEHEVMPTAGNVSARTIERNIAVESTL